MAVVRLPCSPNAHNQKRDKAWPGNRCFNEG